MPFFLFLLVNAMLFVRPVEVMPWLGDLQIYLVCIVACLLVSWPSILKLYNQRRRVAPPILACALGILAVIPLSGIANGMISEAFDHTLEYFKVMIYLVLLVSLVDTPRRLRTFVCWLGIFSATTTLLATLQFHSAVDTRQHESLNANRKKRDAFVQEKFRDPASGRMVDVQRMCGTGLFNDPNDLGLLLVAGVPICLFWLMRREAGTARFLWLGPLALFLYALVLTHSRGSFLALLASLGILFLMRFGPRQAMLAGLAALPLLLVLFAGRMTDFSSSQGTGHSRLHLWSDGLLMFRASPLIGVGMHRYTAHAGLVAHNSFIHCFAELGLFGGCLFLGAFAFALIGMIRIAKDPDRLDDPELKKLFPFLMAIFVSFLVGILFLSRSYVPPTYTMLGLAIVFLRMVPQRESFPAAESEPQRGGRRLILRPLWTLAFTSLAFLMTAETIVRLFAR